MFSLQYDRCDAFQSNGLLAFLDFRNELARVLFSGYSFCDGMDHWRVSGKAAFVIFCLIS